MKYRLLLIAIALLTLSTGSISAQLRFGMKGGVDIVDHKVDTDILKSTNRLGFTVGPTVELMAPGTGWGGELSVLYGHKKYKIEERSKAADISDYNYITIPLNLKKRFGIIPGMVGVYVAAGPYASVKLSGGDLDIEGTMEEYKSKKFEFGVNAGAGITIIKSVEVGIQYRCRLTDNFSTNDPDLQNLKEKKFQTWSVGLTYFF